MLVQYLHLVKIVQQWIHYWKKEELNLAGEDDRERHVATIDLVFALMGGSFYNCY